MINIEGDTACGRYEAKQYKIMQFKKVALKLFPGKFTIKLVHTAQHFNKDMADIFFKQIDIEPDYFLNISPCRQIPKWLKL